MNFEELTFGDKIYIAYEQNNAFKQKKIKMVDSTGIEWFRYDIPNWTYTIQEIEYCGKVTHIQEGAVSSDEDLSTEYYFRGDSEQIFHLDTDYDEYENYHRTREEAELYVEKLKEQRNV